MNQKVFTNIHWPLPLGDIKSDPELVRMKEMMAILGNPHLSLKNVIHIAGTNGKGSIARFLFNIFSSSGYKVNLYSSPHLLRFNERLIVNNKIIGDDVLYQELEEVRSKTEYKINPTFFEGTTAMMFNCFSKSEADINIIECGMGGYSDPTNIVEDVWFSVISSISYDHEEYLGNTLPLIALEKSGIIKKGSNILVAPQFDEVMEVLRCQAKEIGANLLEYERDYDLDLDIDVNNEEGLKDSFALIDIGKEAVYYLPKPKFMLGNHQMINVLLSVFLAFNQDRFMLLEENIASMVENTKLSCRLENISQPLRDRGLINNQYQVWIDGAHNRQGAKVIRDWATKRGHDDFSKNIQNIFIVGRTKGKNHHAFVRELVNDNDIVIAVTVQNEPLPEESKEIVKSINQHQGNHSKKIQIFDGITLENVLFDLKKYYVDNQEEIHEYRIVICGSFYLYRDYFTLLSN